MLVWMLSQELVPPVLLLLYQTLEVSGTVSEDLAARHRLKARQLLDNPFGVDGYVVAVDFAARRGFVDVVGMRS